ncbi:hypothetical protein BDW02DRAFT_646560 [Decorospora gaudefroyi]|uniref:Uncharacterized protein n=1 Tax=Decorospora gaudefroyi TaxID=184978 RepID=A0A6A5KJS4_9PLEO|nr:hypothetical protein BDW02DRAFT_646560 [Decorospora gaudefroyi]
MSRAYRTTQATSIIIIMDDAPPCRKQHRESWIASGVIINYACCVSMAVLSLNRDDLNLIYIMVIFVPCNIFFQSLNLWLWHRERARLRFSASLRKGVSCLLVNVWAVGCVVAFYRVYKAMWIAGWWFIGIPALYSSYLTQMLFTVEMKGKREGGCHLMLFVFAHGPRIAEARWGTEGKEATRPAA